ncbi:HET-domain-containing protein [Acephala macrosclerotiorum]|nr:HET-domain-containing protein [Acephala macrosclerotiorum]
MWHGGPLIRYVLFSTVLLLRYLWSALPPSPKLLSELFTISYLIDMGAFMSKGQIAWEYPSLCRNCRNFNLGTRVKSAGESDYRHSSKADFFRSVDQGCPLCVFLLALIRRTSLNGNLGSDVWLQYKGRPLSGFDISITTENGAAMTIPVMSYLTQDDISPVDFSSRNRPTFARSDDPRCIDLLKVWLVQCNKHHIACSQPQPSKMPSRLLEISGLGQQLSVRLIDATARRERYLTLSYCWGRGDRLPSRLLLANVNEYHSGIAVTSLPQTFQDAIYVVQQLNLKHIWVDSLCIIQDSEEDKLNEITRMDEIYANSYLTLAATDGEDSFAGLFHPRERFPTVRVVWNLANEAYSVHLRQLRYRYEDESKLGSYMKRGLPGHPALDSCLNKRAWTFQERILSPRIVHFTKTQLMWECNCRTTYECTDCPDFDMTPGSQLQKLIESDQKASSTVSGIITSMEAYSGI